MQADFVDLKKLVVKELLVTIKEGLESLKLNQEDYFDASDEPSIQSKLEVIKISAEKLAEATKKNENSELKSLIRYLIQKINLLNKEEIEKNSDVIIKDVNKILTYINKEPYQVYRNILQGILNEYSLIGKNLYREIDIDKTLLISFERNNKKLELLISYLGDNDTLELQQILIKFKEILKDTYRKILNEENGQFRNLLPEKHFYNKHSYIENEMFVKIWNTNKFSPEIYDEKERNDCESNFNDNVLKLKSFFEKGDNYRVSIEDLDKIIKTESNNYFYAIMNDIEIEDTKTSNLNSSDEFAKLNPTMSENYINLKKRANLVKEAQILEKKLIENKELNIGNLKKIMKIKNEYKNLGGARLHLSLKTNCWICIYNVKEKVKYMVANKKVEKEDIQAKKR